MGCEDVWGPFEQVMADPLGWAERWKARSGGKVIGHLLPDVPEEILHAAGALPLAIEGAGAHISRAQGHIPGYTCSHAMGLLEMGLKGDLNVLDGMVIPYVCDTTRNLFHVWSHRFPNLASELLRLPKGLRHPGAALYLRAEFDRLLETVGSWTGELPDTKTLAQSVALYNRSRARLREAYRLHQERPSIWTAERVQNLIGSAMRAPREEHLEWMNRLPWEMQQVSGPNGRVGLYVRGKVWDPPGILGLLDELGLVIVSDEMVTGYRGIACDAPSNADPLMGLAQRLIGSPLYPGYYVTPRHVVGEFVARVRGCGARGVLFLNPKFCEPAGFDMPDLQRALEQEKIPSLVLETSARGGSLAQVRVRLEAFREMLGGELP